MPQTLPRPTDDLEEVRADLEEHGYALVGDALAPDELAEVRGRLVEQAAAEAANGVAYLDTEGANQRLWMLVNKGQVFRDLVLRPLTRGLMEHLLGEGCLLSSLTANIAGPGGSQMGLHTDQGYVPRPYPYPVVANVMWMLDDFTADNGATLVVPGSHRSDGTQPPSTPPLPAQAPAGTAMVFDGRLFHGTGANRTDAPRHGILSYHCRPFMRQQENFFLGLSEQVRSTASDDLLGVLGYRIWARLGRIDAPEEGAIVRPGTPLTGELTLAAP
ncbi:MAG TPA: phytanoyl-CoA dioxygenase family protein [Nitriliruptorales bacterium]